LQGASHDGQHYQNESLLEVLHVSLDAESPALANQKRDSKERK
jgi:hypothetical protein